MREVFARDDLLAKEYLAKTELTIADISHLLDYSETVALPPRVYALEWDNPKDLSPTENGRIDC